MIFCSVQCQYRSVWGDGAWNAVTYHRKINVKAVTHIKMRLARVQLSTIISQIMCQTEIKAGRSLEIVTRTSNFSLSNRRGEFNSAGEKHLNVNK